MSRISKYAVLLLLSGILGALGCQTQESAAIRKSEDLKKETQLPEEKAEEMHFQMNQPSPKKKVRPVKPDQTAIKTYIQQTDQRLDTYFNLKEEFNTVFPEYSEFNPEQGRVLFQKLKAFNHRPVTKAPAGTPKDLALFSGKLHAGITNQTYTLLTIVENYLRFHNDKAYRDREKWKNDLNFTDVIDTYEKTKARLGY
ncbi:hypothetical protein GCM10011571_09960 [Marinithermofilum abyssi]|uniref:Lipoprotein n=1 Tax=Marinithermofilum abyssi TaxID=1571185 RepID=A0A8J2Y8W8_9BACL|nr:hypothetical protein [Marinithermofilum abyssi]GGE10666.1 hypothetical protein GCM10011571_09960 [Marinithermofilum abyssi]